VQSTVIEIHIGRKEGWGARNGGARRACADACMASAEGALPLRSLALPAQAWLVAPPLADRYPVLLVHGIWDSGATFGRMSRYLRGRGFDVRTIDLVPNDGAAGLETLASQIAAYVDAELPPQSPLDLLGFSMGGVVSRYYVQRLGGVERVRRLVTLSSPHHGTATAYLSRRPGSVQMRPDSALLADLNGDLGALARVDFTSIWTPLDLMILPPESSRLPLGREVLVAAPLHGLMLHDPRAFRAVAEALSAPLSARVPPPSTGRPASAA
jgi:triacylglycerol lipase